MADWKIFCDLYTANFGRLTESDGLKEWAKFVEQEVRDVELLRAALQPYIDRYAAALDNMEPVPRISGTSDGTVFAAWNWRNVRVARRGTSRNCVIGSR